MSTATLPHVRPHLGTAPLSVAPSVEISPLVDARLFGCVLLRFHFPNGDDYHISLCEITQPRIQKLLGLLTKLLGVPLLLPPSDKFAEGMLRRAEKGAA